jgi:DNA-binding SARP family transcriptional activator/pimeloyl-ACP methyl ester carboxylesterase
VTVPDVIPSSATAYRHRDTWIAQTSRSSFAAAALSLGCGAARCHDAAGEGLTGLVVLIISSPSSGGLPQASQGVISVLRLRAYCRLTGAPGRLFRGCGLASGEGSPPTGARMVEFHILGPVEVTSGGRSLAIGGARTRAVLAMLLTNANKVVSAGRLVDDLWPEFAPERATANLQVRLSELRKTLRSVGEGDRLLTRSPGYLLQVTPEELDVLRFGQLAAAGREALAAGDPARAVALLDQALALWRGPALADLDQLQFACAERARLEEVRLGALESRIDAQLADGRHNETIAELEALTAEHPLRERFWYQRLLAFYRSGRQADALRAYRQLRSAMVEQLGIEPVPELRELEARILRQDPALQHHPARASTGDRGSSPETRYVQSGGVHIAYQVLGEGERDILFIPGLMSHVELVWDDPQTAEFYRRLATLGRLILFDKRDTGLSDRAPSDATLEERIADVQAVLNAVSSQRAVVFGYSEGAPMSILFAATYPEKVSALILGSAFARWFPAPDYPCGHGAEEVYAAMQEIATHRWGQGATIDWYLPSRSHSPGARELLGRFERMAISPSAFLRMLRMIREIDVRAVLPAIQVPTLVIQRGGDRINPPFYGRYLASHIDGARYFEQPGDHVLRFAAGGDLDALFAEIEQFLAASPSPPHRARVLTTIVFAEAAHDTTAEGDAARHRQALDIGEVAGRHVRTHRGRLRNSTKTSILATFDAPGQAIRSAATIRDNAAALRIQLRAGIHTGEADVLGDQVGGVSVDIAKCVGRRGNPGEILVTRTVKDLVVGSAIKFADRGSHQLAETTDRLPLYAVISV